MYLQRDAFSDKRHFTRGLLHRAPSITSRGGGLFCESKDPSNHGSNFNDDATATSKTVNAVRIEHQEETGKVDFCSMDI